MMRLLKEASFAVSFSLIVTNILDTKILSSFFFNFVVWQPYVY